MATLLSVLDDVPNSGDGLAAVVDGLLSFIMLALLLLWLSLQACVVQGVKRLRGCFPLRWKILHAWASLFPGFLLVLNIPIREENSPIRTQSNGLRCLLSGNGSAAAAANDSLMLMVARRKKVPIG